MMEANERNIPALDDVELEAGRQPITTEFR